jgi:hypothetical protein
VQSLTITRKLCMGFFVLATSVCSVGASSGIATADPLTRFDTTDNPARELQVGVDIAPGLWVGTAAKSGYPGNCEVIRFRSYPPQYTTDGISDTLMSAIETPLTYQITPGGAITLGSGCIWVRIR